MQELETSNFDAHNRNVEPRVLQEEQPKSSAKNVGNEKDDQPSIEENVEEIMNIPQQDKDKREKFLWWERMLDSPMFQNGWRNERVRNL